MSEPGPTQEKAKAKVFWTRSQKMHLLEAIVDKGDLASITRSNADDQRLGMVRHWNRVKKEYDARATDSPERATTTLQ